jgi:hypothetical protein
MTGLWVVMGLQLRRQGGVAHKAVREHHIGFHHRAAFVHHGHVADAAPTIVDVAGVFVARGIVAHWGASWDDSNAHVTPLLTTTAASAAEVSAGGFQLHEQY